MTVALKWERAYYPKDDDYISVSDALEVRRRNPDGYRENPCYNSREDYNEGLGIKLTPVDNSTNYKVDYFRQYGKGEVNGEYNLKIKEKIADDVGLNKSTSNYTKVAMRVKSMINFLSKTIANDKIASKQMMIETVESLDRKNLDIGDVLIHHKPEFHRKTTTIFVKDSGRKPNYKLSDSNIDSISNWIYDIMKIEHDLITNWDKIRPLLMRDWKSFDNSTKRKISRLKEHEEKKKNFGITGLEETDQEREIRETREKVKNFKETGFEETDQEREIRETNEKEKNLKETGYEDTNQERKDREEKSKFRKLQTERENDRIKLEQEKLDYHGRAHRTIFQWDLTYNRIDRILSNKEIKEIIRLRKLTNEENFWKWGHSKISWGQRGIPFGPGVPLNQSNLGKVKLSLEEFYKLVERCEGHIERIKDEVARVLEENKRKNAEQLRLQKERNLAEIGLSLTDYERAAHERTEDLRLQKERNLAEIGLSVTDSERAALSLKSDTFIQNCKQRLTRIYEYCNDFMNDLTPLFHSFLENKSDRKIIPEENRPDLIENLRKTRLLIRETQMTAQGLVNSDELWRSLRKDFIDSQNNAETIFQDIYISIDRYSKIGESVRNILSYFRIGNVKNKITENGNGYGFIYTPEGQDIFFHSSTLRGIKFANVLTESSVLFIDEESKKGVAAKLVFMAGFITNFQ